MNDKKENTKVDELTEQTQNQSAELTDDDLDSVSGGYSSFTRLTEAAAKAAYSK